MKKIILTAVIVAVSFGAYAQSMFGIHWDIGLPMGEMKSDYLGKASFRGFGLEGRWFVTDNLTVGRSFDWQVFYEEEGPDTFTEDVDFNNEGSTPVTVYGRKYKYVNALPIMVTGYYHFGEDGDIRPYIGTGLGVSNMIQRTDLGLFTDENNTWNFALAPEIGVLIPLSFSTAITAGATYNLAFKSGNSLNYSWLTFKIGFAFM
jgi:opacity protein-like surface antigen